MSLGPIAALIRWDCMILKGIHDVGEPGRGFQGGVENQVHRTSPSARVVQLAVDVVGPQDELENCVIIQALQNQQL